MRDALLVARFEVFRAVRTWRALALLVLYGVAAAGAAWLFTRFVGLMENTLAEQLGVATTRVPGGSLSRLVESDMWHDIVLGMVGSEHLVEYLARVPPLAMFDLWFGFLLIPFFAASAAAECLAIDVASRAIRYEALRTGRLELVAGRFLGQAALTGAATLVSVLVVWGVGLGFMVGHSPLELLGWLLWFAPRAWAFGLPFVGIGVAASQLTSSAAWARVMAIGGTAGTWVLYGIAQWATEWSAPWPVVSDLALQLLPQGWLRGLWEPGIGWGASAVACVALSLVIVTTGYLRFSRRDL